MNTEELKEAVNKSDMTTKAKAETVEVLKHITGLANLNVALIKIHTRIPLIYYAAAAFGLGSVVIGMFYATPLAVICGTAVVFVALTGILEVVYIRRKIGI
jgi:hypothetical protein